MTKREPKIYTFSFKRKEIVAVLAGLIITYVMVFLLGIEVGKDLFTSPSTVVTETQRFAEVQEEKTPEPLIITQETTQTAHQEERKIVIIPKVKREERKTEISPIKPVSKAKKKEAIPTSRIFIQAGAFAKKSYAYNLLKRLRERGYKTEIREIGGLYKVILGPYSSEEEAKRDMLKLRKDEKIYGYIIRL